MNSDANNSANQAKQRGPVWPRTYEEIAQAARVLGEQARVAASLGWERQAEVFRAHAREYRREAARLRHGRYLRRLETAAPLG